MEEEVPKEENINKPSGKLISTLVVGAFLSGIVGGVVGVALFNSIQPGFITGDPTRTVLYDEESAVIDVVEETRPSVVSVVGTKQVTVSSPNNEFFNFFFPFAPSPEPQEEAQTREQQVSAGTGFFVSADGLIATNKHVVADETASYQVFTNDGKSYDAEVVAKDPTNDLALLKIRGRGFPVIKLGDSENIQVGQKVIAIGNALGEFRNTVTTGVVSGIGRSIVATGQFTLSPERVEGAIQTDAAINPGNSGGPLVNLAGEVIGINTAISAEGQLLGFAIPVNDLKKDIQIFQERNKIVQPFIGVRYVIISPTLAQERNLPVDKGALVTSGLNDSDPAVVPGSPADEAGLREGDIIKSINGTEITLENTLALALRKYSPGDQINLTILRDGREMEISLTLGERS